MEQGEDALLSDNNVKMTEGLGRILCLCWEGSKAERREEGGLENGLDQEVSSQKHVQKNSVAGGKDRR